MYTFRWTVAIERNGEAVFVTNGQRNYGAGGTPDEALSDLASLWDEHKRQAGDALISLTRAREQFGASPLLGDTP